MPNTSSLTYHDVVLHEDERNEFQDLQDSLEAELQPQGALEHDLFEAKLSPTLATRSSTTSPPPPSPVSPATMPASSGPTTAPAAPNSSPNKTPPGLH